MNHQPSLYHRGEKARQAVTRTQGRCPRCQAWKTEYAFPGSGSRVSRKHCALCYGPVILFSSRKSPVPVALLMPKHLATQIREGAAVPSSLTWDLKDQRSTFQDPLKHTAATNRAGRKEPLDTKSPFLPKGKSPSTRCPKPKQVLQRSVFSNVTQGER